MWWSWVLTAIGVLGIYLAGKKNYWGWGVGLFAQVLWITYGIVSVQYGFIVSAFVYGFVYLKNFRAWRKDQALVLKES